MLHTRAMHNTQAQTTNESRSTELVPVRRPTHATYTRNAQYTGTNNVVQQLAEFTAICRWNCVK